MKFATFALTAVMTTATAWGTDTYTETFSESPSYWSGSGNLTGSQNYGWQDSDFTGTAVKPFDSSIASGPGEMGGAMSRGNVASFYAANIGSLDLNEPLSFSGIYRHHSRASSTGINFGFFNSTLYDIGGANRNQIGFFADDTDVFFMIAADNTSRQRVQMSPVVDLNQGQIVPFKMTYDPAGSGGAGSMSFSIGTVTNSMNLPSSFKANTLSFDKFGLMTVGVAGGGPSFNYFDDLTFTTERPPLRGDFNGDGVHTAVDLDLLSDEIFGAASRLKFDVNGDNVIDQADLALEVESIIGTHFGDTDVDGDVDLVDLGNLAGNYEGQLTKTWAQGDFDADRDVDLRDVGILATNYGSGEVQAMADFQTLVNLPEPSVGSVALLGLAGVLTKRSRSSRRSGGRGIDCRRRSAGWFFALIALFMGSFTAQSAMAANPNEFRVFSRPGLPGRLYVPTDYDPSQNYPLVLFLHGGGEVGANNTEQVNSNIDNLFAEAKSRKVFLYAPQSSTGWGSSAQSLVQTMLGQAQQTYNIDPYRLYITGLSLGGFGTWSMLGNYNDQFAAGVPICGGGNYQPSLIDQPVWAFHARNDNEVSVESSRFTVNAILSGRGLAPVSFPTSGESDAAYSFPPLMYTEYGNGGHDIWPRVYSDQSMYNWLFSQSSLRGDFNPDGKYTPADVDLLTAAIRSHSLDPRHDLDSDRALTWKDLTFFIESQIGTQFGDSDLDGDVDLADLGNLATNYGHAPSGWAQGDFDGDRDVELADLGRLAENYDAGASRAIADFQALTTVPEPGLAALMMAILGLCMVHRRRMHVLH